MKSAYVLTDVSYTYPTGEKEALHNLSLSIPKGKTTALLGPNGAGKSTLMDVLLHWKIPQKGSIDLFDRPLSSYTKKELGKQVSLVPQEEGARFSFSVLDYVLFGRAPYVGSLEKPNQEDVHIALDALTTVGLLSLSHRPISTLSGGEHQLLLLARALTQQPSILLLDEPTSSLDPGNTAKVVQILTHLSAQGITLFFTTHDPSIAAECADYVALLSRSSLLFCGPVKEAITSPLLSNLYATPMKTFTYEEKLIVTRSPS